MVSDSKILTVSYGTFSCTLEGFDDPFSTMRSIAEYFRDLAADDRYFGAEPPTPDAEMLHRIAEREINRKVEARVEENSVVLRQTDSDAPEGRATEVSGEALLLPAEAEISQPQDAPEHMAEAAAEPVETPVHTMEMEPDSEGEITPATAPLDLADSSIAAKLQRIRSVVDTRSSDKSREDIDDGLADDFYAEALAATDEHIEADSFEIEDIAEDAAGDEDKIQIAEGTGEDSLEAEIEDDADNTEKTADIALLEDTVPAQNDIVSSLSAALAEDQGEDDTDNLEDDRWQEDENVFAEEIAPESGAVARVVKVRRAEQQEASEPQAQVESVSAEKVADLDTADEDLGEGDTMLSPQDEAALMAELAEVERGIEDETDWQQQDDAQGEPAPEPVTDVEAEPAPKAQQAANRTAFDDGEYSGTDALDRIMAEANTKLESDEASQKRASIAHLRAAVQAKRAEIERGVSEPDEDTSDEYRDDLALAVQPRRTGQANPNDARRLAPLVLVSEQRVDAQEQNAAGRTDTHTPQMRRVHKENKRAGTSAQHRQRLDVVEEFAAFASEFRAEGPAEVLEAAAAFRTFVKGQETFSRPQVMNLLMKTDPSGRMAREEGLRAFGKLIREGVITKIQRGRYSVSQSTRFRPPHTRASA